MPTKRNFFRTREAFGISFCILILITSLSIVISNDIVWDDEVLIGPYIDQKDRTRFFSEVVTSDLFSGSNYVGVTPMKFWRPLTSALLNVSGRVFGSFLPGYHVLSLLSLFFAMISFFVVLGRLSRSDERLPILFICTAWALHPVGADVIAMVANMADHLSLGFLFLCLWTSIQISKKGLKPQLIVALYLFASLACGSKELGVLSVFMPTAALLLKRTTTNSAEIKRALVSTATCGVAVVLYLIARNSVIGSLDIPAFRSPQEWFLLFPEVIGLFLAKTLVFTPSPTIIFVGPEIGFYFFPGVGLLVTCAIAIAYSVMKGPYSAKVAALGLLLSILTLGVSGLSMEPRSGVIEVPPRYFHVPLAWLLIGASPLVERLAQCGRRSQLAMIAAALLLALGLVTFTRLSDWKTGIHLWKAEVAYLPENIDGHIHLAWAYVKTKRLDAAGSVLKRIEDFPKRTKPQESQRLALEALVISGREKRFDDAIDKLVKARQLTPADPGLVIGIYEMKKAAGRKSAAKQFLVNALREKALSQPRTQRLLRNKLGENEEHF